MRTAKKEKKKPDNTRCDEHVEQLKLSYVAGGNAKYFSHSGKHFSKVLSS